MMIVRDLALAGVVLFVVGCSAPPAKNNEPSNSDPNNSTANNTSGNNTTGNNTTSNNTSGNNTTANNVQNSTTPATDLFANQFDQSCQYDGECAVVFEGDQCQCGGNACANAAISATQIETWNTQSAQLCPPEDMTMCSAAPCAEVLPACVGGGCEVREPVYVDATGWDTSCTDDADCTIVHEGEVCSSCVCGGTAVNVSELPKYQELVDGVECTPGPDFCDCAVVSEAWCNAGACEPGVNPQCVGIDNDGFFSNCNACGENCDTIDTPQGSRNACGCETSADCPCGLSCGDYEIAPNIVVGGICVR